jgi:CBS-domain-containing membrane protein
MTLAVILGSVSASLLSRFLPHARLGIGVMVSTLALAAVGAITGEPLLLAPFAASATIKHAAPDSPMAAPRCVAGGHLLGALVGIGVGLAIGGGTIGLMVAATLAPMLMLGLGVLHPPAVATTFIALQHPGDHWFPLHVALAGAVTLIATALVLSPLLHRRPYALLRAEA